MNDEVTSFLVTSGIRTQMILQFFAGFFRGLTVSNLGILYIYTDKGLCEWYYV